jgi:hypothetical protein
MSPPAAVTSVEELVHELRATRRLMARVGATALLGFGTFTALFSKLIYEVGLLGCHSRVGHVDHLVPAGINWCSWSRCT